MRIDAFQKVSSIYQANFTTKVESVSKKSKADQLEISQFGKDYQVAKAAVANTSDVRMDKINELKARMEAGTYNVSDDDLVDKLVNQYHDEII
ncbi:flagellar biosynthesis anti-sigma factor FlgM [Anaeromicropila herbilytica]|uniref:Negative regulator of flagellin synthesis n=1 Tax=Anaeromicropila herbilytica TaxID=2785025 RepID=A0A7R7EPE9_9FIRM|nr:flagellar biosynthesis anti-sigma factor FlgM [Anaeromicropila herbilytica]BCN32563.1 hypothetical protein bsdtb5_38580 [Anaeromicropila herbilytica]